MYKPKNRWPPTEIAADVLFFSQLFSELVADNTWDSYRAYTLSSKARLRELINLCDEVDKKTLSKPVLEPCLEEIKSTLRRDHVFRSLVSVSLDDFSSQAFAQSSNTRDIKSRCNFLLRSTSGKYKEKCEEIIFSACFDKKDRSKLRVTTKLYVSHLLNIGFSTQFLQRSINEVFFSRDHARLKKATLRNFFKLFSRKDKTYTVYLDVSSTFSKSIGRPGNFLSVIQRKDIKTRHKGKVPKEIGSSARKEIGVTEIQARDRYAAFQTIHDVIEFARAFDFIYPKTVTGNIAKKGFVFTGKESSGKWCELGTPPLDKRRSKYTNHIVQEQTILMNSITRTGEFGESQRRMFRSIATAALADKSESKENQLISLWAAFESLLPPLDSDEGVRIKKFIQYITPALVLDYIYRNFLELDQILVDNFASSQRVENLGNVIVCGTHDQKSTLLKLFSESPIALHKMSRLEHVCSSVKELSRYQHDHEKRIDWQLQRIYRERNNLVHSGARSRFLDPLITNAANYFRDYLMKVMSIWHDQKINDLDACITAIPIIYAQKLDRLSEIQNAVDDKLPRIHGFIFEKDKIL